MSHYESTDQEDHSPYSPLSPTPDSDNDDTEPSKGPTDATEIPDAFASDSPINQETQQDEVLNEIIGTVPVKTDSFADMKRGILKLSEMKKLYNRSSKHAIDKLSQRWRIEIDDDMRLRVGTGKVLMDTDETMLDYTLIVAKCMGLVALIPNMVTANQFIFEMDLKKPYREFKGKHGLVGFDTKGRMLYIGKCMNEDVFLAMAPRSFVANEQEPRPAGYSSGSSRMSTRHSRMVTLMLLHFLPKTRHRSFAVNGDIYKHDIDKGEIGWGGICAAMYVLYNNEQSDTNRAFPSPWYRKEQSIKLNLEDVKSFDQGIISGYKQWSAGAPQKWKDDGLFRNSVPIVVTSRFGQNTQIAVKGNEAEEAESWDRERDFTKVAFLTVALATSIE